MSLWNAGIVGYYGGSVMFHLGRPLTLHPLSRASFEAALFTSGDCVHVEPSIYGDVDLSWSGPKTFEDERASEPAQPWTWRKADRVVEGITWGGNLQILSCLAMAALEIQPPDAHAAASCAGRPISSCRSDPGVERRIRWSGHQ